jgi:site-specific recombinase XerD
VARNPDQTPDGASAVPTELSPEQRTALKNLVERQGSLRLAAIFALGYWARLRISEVATLRLDHCVLNQRAGTITIVGAKGGKTRTLESPFQTGG